MDARQIRSLQPAMAAFAADFRDCFKREATYEHFQRHLLGLQTDMQRKSIEPIALAAGVKSGSGAHDAGVSPVFQVGSSSRPRAAAAAGDGSSRQ